MNETIEDIEKVTKKLSKSNEYFYVRVDSSFTFMQKLKFDKVGPEFYGSERIKFKVINGFIDSGPNADKTSLYAKQADGLFTNQEDALASLRHQLEELLGYDYSNMKTRDMVKAEVDRRFGDALNYYFLTENPVIQRGYEEIMVDDFYDDDNEGHIYGVQYGYFVKADRCFEDHVEVNWFKTNEQRQDFIKRELLRHTNIDEL